jgi:hypothetical protein
MVLEMVYGERSVSSPPTTEPASRREGPSLLLAPAAFAALVLALGVYIPPRLGDALSAAAAVLGGRAP